jgi:putative DNA primase/helicase
MMPAQRDITVDETPFAVDFDGHEEGMQTDEPEHTSGTIDDADERAAIQAEAELSDEADLRNEFQEEATPLNGASHVRIAPTVDLRAFKWSDSGNAERLVSLHGDSLRYVPLWNKWLAWSGKRWVADPRAGSVYRAAKMMVREFQQQAIGDKDALSFAAGCESKKKLDAMVALAAHEKKTLAAHEDFDRDPMLFNVKNGTIDLRTGEMRPHRREDLITKIAPVAYDPKADCPRFDLFLSEIMADDDDLIAFLVAYLGYCLTGDIREHVLAFWHGLGGNGKGVLGAVVLFIMGDYAGKAAPDLLFRSEKTDRHPTEVADLHGKRLVICNETAQNRAWDEATLKDVTGGDRLTARRMREDFWSWDPTHKILVWGNNKPAIRMVDDGIRRRLRLVPFDVSFVGREDRGLVDALKSEAPGILRRLVEGCLAWHKNGLPDAAAVREATEGYMHDEDTLGQFFADECVFAPDAKSTRPQIRKRYLAWSEERDERPVSSKVFTQAVKKRATEGSVRNEAGAPRKGWHGVRVVTDAERLDAGDAGDHEEGQP